MSDPKRIQLRRVKGWRKPDGAVVVARPRRWSNPYRIDVYGISRDEAVSRFRETLTSTPGLLDEARADLAGHDLACWCPPGEPCHADILLELVNGATK